MNCWIVELLNYWNVELLSWWVVVKAAIAFVCTTCKRQLLFALLQLITFVCTNTIENILTTTRIINFCMPCCNSLQFYWTRTFVRTIAIITNNITLLQLLTFKCTIVVDNFFMQYYNWLFLYALLQLTTFVRTIATKDYCMLQTSIANIRYIDCNYAT